MTGDNDDIPYDPRKYPMRLLGAQLAVAAAIGVVAFLTFCVLRLKWPQLFDARRTRRSKCSYLRSLHIFFLFFLLN